MTQTKKNWFQKLNSYFLGNRRLRSYIFSIIKFTAVTMIQGNDSFPKDIDAFYFYQDLFVSLGYSWMGVLFVLFTERYLREVICKHKKIQLAQWMNWVEAVIFTVYSIYGTFFSILHWISIGMKSSTLGPTTTLVYVINQLVIQLMIWEKWTHFLHSGHSVSLFLEKDQHIPPYRGEKDDDVIHHEKEEHDEHKEHDEHDEVYHEEHNTSHEEENSLVEGKKDPILIGH